MEHLLSQPKMMRTVPLIAREPTYSMPALGGRKTFFTRKYMLDCAIINGCLSMEM
jgi:hypothetical protein